MHQLEFYKHVKSEFGKEMYLDTVHNHKDRNSLTRLRISAHRLEIELGRRSGIPRQNRTCKWCTRNSLTNEIEDESHFLNVCSSNNNIRNILISKVNSLLTNHNNFTPHQPITLDIIQLTNFSSSLLNSVSPENQAHLCRITARYVNNAFVTREKFIDSLKAPLQPNTA